MCVLKRSRCRPFQVGRPCRVRQAFSSLFSRGFCPNWDRENWPAMGSPAQHPALHYTVPFLDQNKGRLSGKRVETKRVSSRPTRKPWPGKHSRCRVEGRVVAGHTGIGLGRKLMRIGQRWAALRTALLSVAQGPFSPRAWGGCLEKGQEATWPTRGPRHRGVLPEES